MFRLKKLSSGWAKNHEVLYSVSVRIWDPRWLTMCGHSHIVKNCMVLSLAWRWSFKSKHVTLTHAFII